MFDITVVVALIVALGQAIKQFVPTRFMPLVSLALGLIAGAFVLPHETIQEGVINGLAAGLAAMGLFDLSKLVTKSESKIDK